MKEPELDIINGMPEDNRDWTFYPSVRYFFRTSYISAVDVSSLQRGIILRICDRVSPVLVAYAKSFKTCSRTHGDPNVEDTRALEPLLSSSIIGVDGDFDRVGICIITIGVEHMNNAVQKRRGIHSGGVQYGGEAWIEQNILPRDYVHRGDVVGFAPFRRYQYRQLMAKIPIATCSGRK